MQEREAMAHTPIISSVKCMIGIESDADDEPLIPLSPTYLPLSTFPAT
jgi:hypothetical protein